MASLLEVSITHASRDSGEEMGKHRTSRVPGMCGQCSAHLYPKCSDKKVQISGRGARDRAYRGVLTVLTAGWRAHWQGQGLELNAQIMGRKWEKEGDEGDGAGEKNPEWILYMNSMPR